MTSASAASEDLEEEVQFVSEAPLRPVLEYIDLLSDGDDEKDAPSVVNTCEEDVDRQRAHAASVLDRLAQQVAVEKQERADKCKAFKEKMISQQNHGRRERAITHGDSADAKRCVDIWLKMPGVKPGSVNSGVLWRRRLAPTGFAASPRTCPVVNCRRQFDNVPLLQGHLKRFDHSPCDPSITLRGGAELSICVCVSCGRHFPSPEAWRAHTNTQCSSESRLCQTIACFACPTCCCFFSSLEQCHSHMTGRGHQRHTISLSDKPGPVVPVPIPALVKNRLSALCKDVPFRVRCSICSQTLSSHMEATAHFNVHCRNGSAIAMAEHTVVDIVKKMAIVGHCLSCPEVFLTLDSMQQHREQRSHEVKRVNRLDAALLLYSSREQTGSALKVPSTKRKRPENCSKSKRGKHQCAWFCECNLRFIEEDQVRTHLQSANQIFHKCAVCGKLMGESSIARLHMSRFHGGAHLSNFLFYCRKCNVEMARMEDIMVHVGLIHQGHRFYEEREDAEAAKPSTSVESDTRSASPPKPESWLCRMCEDLFESEAAVKAHCADLSGHSFQRFACGHCPQKFFKETTLQRHCANEHTGELAMSYFCGLCDSMLFDSERQFLEHYSSMHSQDYYCLERPADTPQTQTVLPQTHPCASHTHTELDCHICACMGSEKTKEERKAVFTECMKQLAVDRKCRYNCRLCEENTASYSSMKAHVLLKHSQGNGKSFDVLCETCTEVLPNVAEFHSHYHEHHCEAPSCKLSRATANAFNAEELCPQKNSEELEDVKRVFSASVPDVNEQTVSQENVVGDTFDQELKKALALSLEESRSVEKNNNELEEALKRSLEDF